MTHTNYRGTVEIMPVIGKVVRRAYTARMMWDEYEHQRLSTSAGREAARVIFTYERNVDLGLTVFPDLDITAEPFRVYCLAWNDPGPAYRYRESWVMTRVTLAAVNADYDRGYPVLFGLYVMPDWVPVWAFCYRPDLTCYNNSRGFVNILAGELAKLAAGGVVLGASTPGKDGLGYRLPDIVRVSPYPWEVKSLNGRGRDVDR